MPDDRKLCLTVGDMEHFAEYITEKDIRYIASLGMDHIRLGFDQIVIEESPFVYREETLKHIDNFISWCKKYKLIIVLNLHKTIENYCNIKENMELLDNERNAI
ncbi:MAG: cellulase family glycosylhydrolase [Firmicutes bacterium]|nr:cellulase family glycosylhydrolase [Bacillota bacterium]